MIIEHIDLMETRLHEQNRIRRLVLDYDYRNAVRLTRYYRRRNDALLDINTAPIIIPHLLQEQAI